MSQTISIDDIKVGHNIRFKSINPHDNTVWNGIVTAICNYKTAKAFSDVDAYYADIRRVNPSFATKEELRYLILDVTENNDTSVTRVFALEWMDPDTLKLINIEDTYRDIRIYNISEQEITNMLSYIAQQGFTCTEIK